MFFVERGETCEITLPLQREHDFTGSGYLKLHGKPIRIRHTIYATRKHTESMENYANVESKSKPESIIILENVKQ